MNGGQRRVWLVMKTAAGERPFPISKDRTVIGQEAASDVRVPLPAVAPRHCEIVATADGLHLRDLGSDAGTLHNGHPVDQADLSDHDQVTIGPVTFHVRVAYGDDHDHADAPDDRGAEIEVKPQPPTKDRV
ncbi:MAG: FHA domain-containing protein [Planctomycetes bacterium]|nr:FHA domain-containing protein [Planctomycetota bacterium]